MKDTLHPNRLMPWIAVIAGQLSISFKTHELAMQYGTHRIKWLREDFRKYVRDNIDLMVN